jgi:DNA (cytosine-5)-methyltransferase 1
MGSHSGPIVVDLFCGAGGLSEGLRQAGFDPRVAIDFDPNAIATYKANHPETETILGNVEHVTGEQIKGLAGSDDIDLIAGGPSCQGFSTHGKRIQDDPRNFLFKHFVRLVDEVRPKMFLMENVRGMLTYGKGYFKKQIEEAFEEIGYRTRFTQVCAADYGVPQLRHRVLFIGTRIDDIELSFPEPTHGAAELGLKPHLTVQEALSDLPLMNGDFKADARSYLGAPLNDYQRYARRGAGKTLTMHVSNRLSDQAQEIANVVQQGQGLRSVPPDALPDRFKKMRTIGNGALRRDCTTLYYRLNPARPSYTITCYYRNIASGPFLHPWEDRSLSHREAARLMSFPDSYKFMGSNFTRQIGNAVPVLMAKAIGT